MFTQAGEITAPRASTTSGLHPLVTEEERSVHLLVMSA